MQTQNSNTYKLKNLNASVTNTLNAIQVNADDLVCVALYNMIQCIQQNKQYNTNELRDKLNAAYDDDIFMLGEKEAHIKLGREYANKALYCYELNELDTDIYSAYAYAIIAVMQRTETLDWAK